MRTDTTLLFPTCALMLAGLAACAKSENPPGQGQVEAAGPRTVHVTATDFAFQLPDTLASGLTSFHLMNNGQEPHHLVVIRLGEGLTLADLGKLEQGGEIPAGMAFLGGPNVAVPAGSAEAVVDLKPGHYALICLIPGTDLKPHLGKGMAKELTVVQGETAPQAPAHDVTLKLTDYAFEVSTPLTAGRHVIRIENAGPQLHEVVLVKLEPGKTLQEMGKWVEKLQGPPPGTFLSGGAAPMSSGEANVVTVDLTPGEYGFLCFVPDSKDGKPHVMHGMLKQFTVM